MFHKVPSCLVCSDPLVVEASYLDEGTECEREETCRRGCYFFRYAYGNSEERIGEFEQTWSWTDNDWHRRARFRRKHEERTRELLVKDIDPRWLTSTVIGLCKQICGEEGWDGRRLLGILADALQDAGCDNQDWLNHLMHDEHPQPPEYCYIVAQLLQAAGEER